MRTVVIATVTATAWLFYVTRHFNVSCLIGIIIGIMSGVVSHVIRKAKREQELRECIEPLFILPVNPENGQSVFLPTQLVGLCYHAPTRRILMEEKRLRLELERAKNPFFEESLTEVQKLPIITFRYQDGERVNETWEEFTEYVTNRMFDIRSDWHKRIKAANPEWYEVRRHKIVI